MLVTKKNVISQCIKARGKEQLEFDDIMDFWPSNQYIYKEIRDEIEEVVPMIGAGLTQNIVKEEYDHYPSWEELLKKCAEDLGHVNKTNIEKYIKEGSYEEAAQEIVNIIGKGGLLAYVKDQYDPNKIDSLKIKDSPLTVFPHLFDNLMLTTNYDKAVEYAYDKAKPLEILLPTARKREFVDVLRKKRKACVLYKFHGDIERGLEDIILTKDSYDRNYGKKTKIYDNNDSETELVRNLSFCLLAHPILFLGCSLKSDRIMDLLLKNKEVNHFAFVACGANRYEDFDEESATEEAIKRNKELDENNIHAIFYPRYDRGCIKKILDELMKHKKQISNDSRFYQVFRIKEDWMYEFISKLNVQQDKHKSDCIKKHIVIFGGIFSEIRKYHEGGRAKENIDNLNNWLLNNKEAKLFICYDSEEAATHRARQTAEGITTTSRVEKVESIRELPKFFSGEVINRVYLIPIVYSLTGYSVLADNELYWNIITQDRSSKGPILKILDDLGEGGKLEKVNKISYMLYALQETKSILLLKKEQKDNGNENGSTYDPIFENQLDFENAILNIDELEKLLKNEHQKIKL